MELWAAVFLGMACGTLIGAAAGRTEMLHQLGWTWGEFFRRVDHRKRWLAIHNEMTSKAAKAMKNPPRDYDQANITGDE